MFIRFDGAFAIGAAIEVGVHKVGLEVGQEFFIDVGFAETGGDFCGDDAEAGAEFVDEAEEGVPVDERGAAMEKAGGEGGFVGFLGEDGVAVRAVIVEVGNGEEGGVEAVGEDGAGG